MKRPQEMRFVYSGERLRALCFPLGGIGTGTVALCGDGGLRQWQIFNNINHAAHVPHSFFAVFVKEGTKPPKSLVLQSNDLYDRPFEAAPSVSDHVVPRESRTLLEQLPDVHDLEFIGEYPIAEIRYSLGALPLELSLQAYSPFVPLDPDDSGLPVAVFHFTAANRSRHRMDISLLMCQQNAVGWDDSTEIAGVSHSSFGGNRNILVRQAHMTAISMDNETLPKKDSRFGQMMIAALDESASACTQWTSLNELWSEFSKGGRLGDSPDRAVSPPSRTLNGALAQRLSLKPGESKRITFLLAWRFPNRYVDWVQPTLAGEQNVSPSDLWIGNHYAARFGSAQHAAEYVIERLAYFDETASNFREALHDCTLPAPLIEAVSTQISVVRSPTCFRAADGRFYGFEGCLGASTEMMGDRGGCCPLNCTHVWNYAMTVARLFPQLERSMREIEWLHQQHESGYLPHRVVVPLDLRRPWDRWIGGPPYPALDGLLGAVLKTYREFQSGAGMEWLRSLWDHVRRAMDHVMDRYDRGDGVIIGPQPCTYDVEIEGPNSFIISLYLASLRAAEEMAKAVGDTEARARYRERFRSGKKTADTLLWNGEYYIHKHDPAESVQAYGTGCHSDQLFGQWWAYALGLGYVLPPAHVRTALRSVLKYNWRDTLREHEQFPRRYLNDGEAGLLNCSWPKDGRPETPLLYSDEIWTGIEYEVAGALLFEGMVDEAMKILKAVRKRQDGRLRSPWNEVECGDHYVRPMSSWMLLEAASGFSYDASKGVIRFHPRMQERDFASFFAAGRAWGRYTQRVRASRMTARLLVYSGIIKVRQFHLSHHGRGEVTAKKGNQILASKSKRRGNQIHVQFSRTVEVGKDEFLGISIH